VIFVGGLIAVWLGATVAVLSKNKDSAREQQVVVVGGGRDELPSAEAPTVNGAPSAKDTEPGGANAASSQIDQRAASPHDEASSGNASAPNTSTRNPAAGASSAGQAQLARAVQQKSGSFQACFVQHLEAGQAAPAAVLHFEVAKAGGAAQVEVEPPAVAGTALGRCLVQAGGSVRFPSLDQPVSFRVPVRARVSQASGK
jgi:hypothetical protein